MTTIRVNVSNDLLMQAKNVGIYNEKEISAMVADFLQKQISYKKASNDKTKQKLASCSHADRSIKSNDCDEWQWLDQLATTDLDESFIQAVQEVHSSAPQERDWSAL